MKRVIAAAAFSILLLQGCSWIKSWGEDEPGDPAPLVEFEPSLKVGKVWSVSVGDGMGKQGLSMGPVYSSGALFAADYEGKLLSKIELPVSNVTACAFGGKSLDQMFITTATAGLDEKALAEQPLAGNLFAAYPGMHGVKSTMYKG